MVVMSNGFSGGGSSHWLYVNGVPVSRSNEDASTDVSLSAIVPNGSTYKYTCSSGSVYKWAELR